MNASCWICGSEYGPWHVCPLDRAIVSIAGSHISEVFRQCANSSAGSSGDPIGFLTPIPQSSRTVPTTQPTGTNGSGKHIDDKWWTAQDHDARYLAEMEDQLRQWEDDER